MVHLLGNKPCFVQMFEWIRAHVALFLERYAIIGDSHEAAQIISREHDDFATAARVCHRSHHLFDSFAEYRRQCESYNDSSKSTTRYG